MRVVKNEFLNTRKCFKDEEGVAILRERISHRVGGNRKRQYYRGT